MKKNCLVFGLPGDGKRWTDAGHRLVFLDHRDDAVRTARHSDHRPVVATFALDDGVGARAPPGVVRACGKRPPTSSSLGGAY